MWPTWNDVLRGKEQWQVYQAQRNLGDDHADSSSSARPNISLCEEMGKPKTTNKQTETNQMLLSFNKVVKIFFLQRRLITDGFCESCSDVALITFVPAPWKSILIFKIYLN